MWLWQNILLLKVEVFMYTNVYLSTKVPYFAKLDQIWFERQTILTQQFFLTAHDTRFTQSYLPRQKVFAMLYVACSHNLAPCNFLSSQKFKEVLLDRKCNWTCKPVLWSPYTKRNFYENGYTNWKKPYLSELTAWTIFTFRVKTLISDPYPKVL